MLEITLDLTAYYPDYKGKYTDAVWVGNSSTNAEAVKWITHSADYFAVVVFGDSGCGPFKSPHEIDKFVVNHNSGNGTQMDLVSGVVNGIRDGSLNSKCEFEFCYIMIRNDFKHMWINCCTKTFVQQVCPSKGEEGALASVDVLYDDSGGVVQSSGVEGVIGGIFSLFPAGHGLREGNLPDTAVFNPKSVAARPKLIVRR
jgi:hypothetical protein